MDEFAAVENISLLQARLEGARLFQVKGRSMEPIALEDQFVMTHDETVDDPTLARLDGELVIAVDETGAKDFKRFRRRGNFALLESVNSDRITSSEILSIGDGGEFPALAGLMSVVGVLFELP